MYELPAGVESRWASPENPAGAKGQAGRANAGRKGSPTISLKAGQSVVLAEARATKTVRIIDRRPDARLTLDVLARKARLSRYHFLRTFEQLTGVTPHQYARRARLREAAMKLAAEPGTVLDIALDCGFGDVSNFNRAFRTEFGMSPRAYRARVR